MINVILILDKNYGYLPFNKLYEEKIKDSILIVGRKTYQKLPNVKNKIVFCISRNISINSHNNDCVVVFQSIDEAIIQAKQLNKSIFIVGGNQIFDYVFKNYKQEIIIHMSLFNYSELSSDSFFDKKNLLDFYIFNEYKSEIVSHYKMKYQKYGENQYPIEKETIDLSKVESVVVEYNEKFQSYYVNAYLKGNYYKRTNTHSEAFTVNVNWFNYYGFKDKKEAEKIQNILIKLCKYCGSNPLKY